MQMDHWKWTKMGQNGPRMDPKWIGMNQNESFWDIMDPKWTQNESK